jgi:DNA-binding response OmpR family regulator
MPFEMQHKATIIAMTDTSRLTNNNNKSITKKRILIIDDEDDINLALKVVLDNDGFEVTTFNDPLEALRNLKTNLYDLVLLDIRMPTMDGLSVYQRIRKLDDKVEICFLTAGSLNLDEEFAKQVFPILEKDRFIRKPVSNEELIKRVKQMTLTE